MKEGSNYFRISACMNPALLRQNSSTHTPLTFPRLYIERRVDPRIQTPSPHLAIESELKLLLCLGWIVLSVQLLLLWHNL